MAAQETVVHGVADALDLDAALRALHVATFYLDQLAAESAAGAGGPGDAAGDAPVEQTRILVRQATAVLTRAQ